MMRKFEREGLFIGGDDARETDRQILHHNEAIRGLPVLSRQHRYSSAIQHNILGQDREGTFSHVGNQRNVAKKNITMKCTEFILMPVCYIFLFTWLAQLVPIF